MSKACSQQLGPWPKRPRRHKRPPPSDRVNGDLRVFEFERPEGIPSSACQVPHVNKGLTSHKVTQVVSSDPNDMSQVTN